MLGRIRIPVLFSSASRCFVIAIVMWWSPLALSAEPPDSPPIDPQTVEAARYEFLEGTTNYQAKRWAEALKAFEHSFALASSPNTQLMIARCLRELGRKAEAAATYSDAATEAHKRVMRGESKYTQTADAAAAEGSQVRGQLGTIHVHVARSAGRAVTIDKRTVVLSKDGDATVLHDPGSVTVAVTDPTGAEQRQSVTVQAGATVQMDFGVPSGSSALPPPPPATSPTAAPPHPETPRELAASSPERTWAYTAALISGGVSVVGLGCFIGFGASSQSTYDALHARCGDHCGAADRAEADSGRRAQTIANVSLGISLTAAALTAIFVVLELTADKKNDKNGNGKSSRAGTGGLPATPTPIRLFAPHPQPL